MGRNLVRIASAGVMLLLAACSGAVRWEEPATPPRAAVPRPADRPGWHTVQPGETLFRIASRYGLGVTELARWNDLGDGSMIRVGQRLRLSPPGGAVGASADTRAGAPPAGIESPPRWQWPVNGPVVGTFGASPVTASGVHLGGRTGDPVRAAAAGQVVYAGSGLVGYGELLIIKHSSNWLTAYGYNRELLVREGEQVSAGQIVARMGEGPTAAGPGYSPALHFEIRRNGEPLNPLTELPPSPR